jgi:alpha-galactosidase
MRTALLTIALLAPVAVAADLAGSWQFEHTTPSGHKWQVVYVFKTEGNQFTGMMYSPSDRENVLNGLIDGNQITFETHMEFYPPDRTTAMKGELNGETLTVEPVRPRRRARDWQMAFHKISSDTRFVAPDGWGPSRPHLPPFQPIPPNGLALTPPMGWNSWNKFGGRIDDKTVREIADAMVSSGMRDAGYRYINIDDTWEGERDAQGDITSNSKFPDMKALADYVHSKGLKLGIYSGPGRKTCAGYEGSYGHEEQDAATYAKWGIDYLKYDWCSASAVYHPDEMASAYRMMALALRHTGRPIVLSLCEYGWLDVGEWGAAAGGNLWRTTGDISDRWDSMSRIGFGQNGREKYAGPGHWNDPDMLEIGNGGMTDTEYRTHMSLWSMLAAPLIAGNDLRTMSDQTRAILTNKDVIAIDQDKLGAQGFRIRQDGDQEVWKKPLSDGVAVGLFNRGEAPAKISVKWSEVGFNAPGPQVRDLWAHKNIDAPSEYTAEVPAHGVVLLRLQETGPRTASRD